MFPNDTVLSADVERLVHAAKERGADPSCIAAALLDATPELIDRRAAHANVERAFDAYHASVPEMEGSTEPFVRAHCTCGADGFLPCSPSCPRAA